MHLEAHVAGAPPDTAMPHASHRRVASTSKRAARLDGGNSKVPEVVCTSPPSPPPVANLDPDPFHKSASDVDLPTSTVQGAYQDGHVSNDGFKRAYSDRFLSRASSESARAPKPASPKAKGKAREGHRRQKSEQTAAVSQRVLPEDNLTHTLVARPKTLSKKPRDPAKGSILANRVQDSSRQVESEDPSWPLAAPDESHQDGVKEQHVNQGGESPQEASVQTAEEPGPLRAARSRPLSTQRNSMSGGKSRRSLSSFLTRKKSLKGYESPNQTTGSASSSTDRLPLPKHDSSLPAMPSPASKERYQSAGLEIPRKKDELGSIFRSLESDYDKFASKPGPLKANIVRNSLLPFLRNYAEHPSWTRLRPEDLDRRINVLNKWWTGMLELLSGKNGQSVSASDRPTFLEAISSIMTRPEWRITSSTISSVSNRSRTTIKSRSSTSVDSSTSDFLIETIISNVRHAFIQNLLAQTVFVVERMSTRSTPASVVTFCGKAIAYAFFYCPGIAEILVRLWELPGDAFRRVLNEHGIPRNANLEAAAEAVAPDFPPPVQSLAFTSVPKLVRYLRQPAYSPFDMSAIDWDGPWKSRWQGKESDLFFCFVKHYYNIVSGMIPDDATLEQQVSAPTSLLLQTQLLTVMDNNIRGVEQEAQPEPFDGPAPVTFDDLLGPDASAEPLPGRVPTASRSMAENRLIMLLREVLSSARTMPDGARRSFAAVFDLILKATAKRISLYDHTACLALCDFLEEAIVILARYHGNAEDPAAFLDWEFWLKVLRQMGESHNSTTDIRLYALLYALWGYIAKNPDRKRAVCVEWLLTEDYATRQLCHWCPMVRAYYMRLVCWRVVRLDGRPAAHDSEIFKIAHQRLRDVWNYFLHTQHEASKTRGSFLSTAPANPAPQRRFLIMRSDSTPTPEKGFLSFDTMVAATSSSRAGASDRSSSSVLLEPLRQMTHPDLEDPTPAKRGWLRGLKSIANSSSSPTPTQQSPSATTEVPEEKKDSASAASPSHPQSQSHPKRPSQLRHLPSAPSTSKATPGSFPSPTTPPSPHSPTLLSGEPSSHSFKFSLEWMERAIVPRDRKLAPPNLPGPAQRFLMAQYPTPPPTKPQPPPRYLAPSIKYSGRALAEWAVLLDECRGFYERRRQEGVLELRLVETPTLGVESFRRPVG